MALERKDVRFKLDADEHARLVAVAAHDSQDMGEWVEQLVLRELANREAFARRESSLLATLERVGISGKSRENPGNPGEGGR